MDVPALATTGSAVDARPAALGQPGTSILFGNGAVNDDSRSGGRFALGKWFCPCRCYGIEVSYLVLAEEDSNFSASNNDFAVLGRPFVNTVTNAQDARLIANPGIISGSLVINTATQLQSLELLFRSEYESAGRARVEFVVGYRFAELKDRVRIDTSTLALSGPTAGVSTALFDQFDTRNSFHGGELGMIVSYPMNSSWSCEAVAKFSVGGTGYRADVFGQTTTTNNAGASTTTQGGLLTQGTNIGVFRWNDFATLSEVGVTLRRELPYGLTASLGYSFIYWSTVARAGEQIDATVNPTQIPPSALVGQPRPAFPFATTDFWAQGLRLGLEARF